MGWALRVRAAVGGAGLGAALVSAASARGPIAPSTEEAVARGPVYQMQTFPRAFGAAGFGCAYADVGTADLLAILANRGEGLPSLSRGQTCLPASRS